MLPHRERQAGEGCLLGNAAHPVTGEAATGMLSPHNQDMYQSVRLVTTDRGVHKAVLDLSYQSAHPRHRITLPTHQPVKTRL